MSDDLELDPLEDLDPKPLKELYENASNLCELLIGPAVFDQKALFFRTGLVMSQSVSFSIGPDGGESRLGRLTIARNVLEAARAAFPDYGVALLRRPKDIFIYLSNAKLAPTAVIPGREGSGIEIWPVTDVTYKELKSYKALGGAVQ